MLARPSHSDQSHDSVQNPQAAFPPESDGSDLAEFAESLGVTPAYVDAIGQSWRRGAIEAAQIAGFTADELNALYAQGMDFVRRTHYTDAVAVFVYLAQLDRQDVRYLRGLALAFHCMHEFGWSHNVCQMALDRAPNDLITWVLMSEATLYLSGKRAAHKSLTYALTLKATNSDELLYLERARQILAKLRIAPAK